MMNRRDFLKLLGSLPLIAFTDRLVPRSEGWSLFGSQDKPPNILILVFDAFSAAHCSFLGYQRDTTPKIEELASQATVFHRHYAGGNFTSPGTASLLTGTYPWTHRVLSFSSSFVNHAGLPDIFSVMQDPYYRFAYTHNPIAYFLLHALKSDINNLTKISDLCLDKSSLADTFFEHDYPIAMEAEKNQYRNLSFPSGSLFFSPAALAHRLAKSLEINRRFKNLFPRGVTRFSLDAPPAFLYFLLEDAVDWLIKESGSSKAPYLGYVHLFPPHSPYITRRDFYNRFSDPLKPVEKPDHFFSQGHSTDYLNDQAQKYDEYIAYVDAEFGRLFQALKDAGELENTCLILTSDHGEMFERGIAQHNTPTLYEPIVRVPLVIWSPGQTHRKDVHIPTSNLDLLPTLCKLAGLPIPTECEGIPLPLDNAGTPDPDRPVYVVEAKENPREAPLRKATIAMVLGDHKLIHTMGYPEYPDPFELYNLAEDPDELNNLFREGDPVSIALRDKLLAKIAEVNQGY